MNDADFKGLFGYALLCVTAAIIHSASMIDSNAKTLTVVESVERAAALMDAADKAWKQE